MFKKRFTIGNVLTKCSGLKDNGKLMTFNEVVRLLNEQHKQIQFYRIDYGQLVLDFEELKHENEQLKSFNQDLSENLSVCADKRLAQGEHLTKLNNENEQLKKQLEHIQNSITEHIKHQKTELGQKALKEIIADYNEWMLGHKELEE